ncbi:MAG TPA: AAA family ATPase [Flavobacteriaceae bacterium]|nr:AAA family ATPase [Flavobacteriaceae bacterium]
MHETWTDPDSGYNCKIIKFSDDRFKAIAKSPDGETEISFERRNRHIAKRELIAAIHSAREKNLNKKTGKSKRAKKRKERKLRAQKRNAEIHNHKGETANSSSSAVVCVVDKNDLSDLQNQKFSSEVVIKVEEMEPPSRRLHNTYRSDVKKGATVDEKPKNSNVIYTISSKSQLYVPIWNRKETDNIIYFELRGNSYHEKPTSDILILSPDPSNPFDSNAIRVLDSNHRMIGYVPKEIVSSKNTYNDLTKNVKNLFLEKKNNKFYVKVYLKPRVDSQHSDNITSFSTPDNFIINKNSNYIFSDNDNNIYLDEYGILSTKDDQGFEETKTIPDRSLAYFFNHCASLTDEQKSVILLTCARKTFKVNAFAGTGKTTTILNAAKAFPMEGKCYLAFNAAIAKEVRELKISGLKTYTIHQYARSLIIKKDIRYLQKLSNPGIDYRTDSEFLESASYTLGLDRKELLICLSIISNFSKTDSEMLSTTEGLDGEIKKWLIDDVFPKLTVDSEDRNISELAFSNAKVYFIEKSICLFNYIVDPDIKNTFLSFEIYLKLWQLNPMHLDENIFFVDEAQDIDPVMFSALKKIGKQTVWVGDSYQQIYRWRGAINAMNEISARAIYLTETFRFDQIICNLANFCLNKLGESRKIVSSKRPNTDIPGSQKITILFRTNLNMIELAFSYAGSGQKIFFPSFKNSGFLKILEFYCLNIIDFRNEGIPKGRKLKKYSNFSELSSLLNSNDIDQDLVQAYRIAEVFSWNKLAIESSFQKLEFALCESPDAADVLMCTAHSAKGREWDFIEIFGDFEHFLAASKQSDDGSFRDELMLFYVAITRAKKAITNIEIVEGILSRIFSCNVGELKDRT